MAAEGYRRRDSRSPAGRRQWGRGRMAAEGAGLPLTPVAEQTGVNGAAAGWPRKACIALAGGPDYITASMGPRPDGRGRVSLRRIEACRLATASMGPRPDGRGRIVQVVWNASLIVRQWGRGRMAAEGLLSCSPCRTCTGVNGAAAGWPRKARAPGRHLQLGRERQWGRGRMAAEGRGARRRRPCVPAASMGPRPDGRGRALNRAISLPSYDRRQWGRGRMAAEGFSPCPDTHTGGSVNGAAAGWPRKGRIHA